MMDVIRPEKNTRVPERLSWEHMKEGIYEKMDRDKDGKVLIPVRPRKLYHNKFVQRTALMLLFLLILVVLQKDHVLYTSTGVGTPEARSADDKNARTTGVQDKEPEILAEQESSEKTKPGENADRREAGNMPYGPASAWPVNSKGAIINQSSVLIVHHNATGPVTDRWHKEQGKGYSSKTNKDDHSSAANAANKETRNKYNNYQPSPATGGGHLIPLSPEGMPGNASDGHAGKDGAIAGGTIAGDHKTHDQAQPATGSTAETGLLAGYGAVAALPGAGLHLLAVETGVIVKKPQIKPELPKRKQNWYIGLTGGAGVPIMTGSLKVATPVSYYELKETGLMSPYAKVFAKRTFGKNFYAGFGGEWQQYRSYLSYKSERQIRLEVKDTILAIIHNRITGEISYERGDTTVDLIETRKVNHTNVTTAINIPVCVGWYTTYNRWTIGTELGAVINIYAFHSGKTYNSFGEIVRLDNKGTYLAANLGLSLYGGINAGYLITDRHRLLVEFSAQKSLRDWRTDLNPPSTLRPWFIRLGVGMEYKF